MSDQPLLQLRGVTKRFPGERSRFQRPRRFDPRIAGRKWRRQVHVDQSAHGRPSAGRGHPEPRWAAHSTRVASPNEAERLGISTVYQEVNLIPALSVAENIALGRQPGRFGFVNWRAVADWLTDNAFLGIAAIGMTLIIVSAGIDLSAGAAIRFTSIFTATLIAHGISPVVVWLMAVLLGAAFGGMLGTLIHVFRLPPFLITLAGMFLARGLTFWLSTESVAIHQSRATAAVCAPGRYPP